MPKIAVITDFLNQLGGAEKVTSEIYQLFPGADLYTMFYTENVKHKLFGDANIIQHPLFANSEWRRRHYRKLFPFYPTYIEDLNLVNYDLVISSSYLWSKGVLVHPDTTHISYVHTPIRQAWIKYHEYLNNEHDIGRFNRIFLRYIMNYVRTWDVTSASRVDYFVANSSVTQNRIRKIYRRDATVIHPPIEIQAAQKYLDNSAQKHYVTIGRLVPYKRVDLIVQAFNNMPDKELYIIGDGNDRKRLEEMKTSKRIHFLGYTENDMKMEILSSARAFIFAAEEDFGMSPVEAMACGVPVIGYGRGGTIDYLQPHVNSVVFRENTVQALINAVYEMERSNFNKYLISRTVEEFDAFHFRSKLKKYITSKLTDVIGERITFNLLQP